MTLRPLVTACAKDYKGHSLMHTSFTEPPNSASVQKKRKDQNPKMIKNGQLNWTKQNNVQEDTFITESASSSKDLHDYLAHEHL